MNDLLVSVNGMDIYRNDMVRYYTELHDKVQFGIVTDYDDFDNKLTVSAVVSYKINPVNVLERYSQEEWQDIKFTKYPDHVSMEMYPFKSDWSIIEKKGRTNKVLVETPYTKYTTFSWSRIEEIGYVMFKEQLELTAASIINNEVMEFSFNNLTDLEEVRVIRNLPYEGEFKINVNTLISYANNFQTLKQQIINGVQAVIASEILKTGSSEIVDLSKIGSNDYTSTTSLEYEAVMRRLPYKAVFDLSMDTFLEMGGNDSTMMKQQAMNNIKDALNTQVLKGIDLSSTTLSNGTNVVMVSTPENEELNSRLPFKSMFDMNADAFMEYGTDHTGLKKYVMDTIKGVLDRDVLQGLTASSISTVNGTTMITLPYIETSTMTTKELLETNDRDMLYREIQQRGFEVLKSIISRIDLSSQSTERYIILPYRQVGTMKMDVIWDYGLQYFYESIANNARRVILNNLIKQYQFSNGVTIVMNLPFSGDWTLDEHEVLSVGREEAENRVLRHIEEMLYTKARTFRYGIVMNKGQFNMSMFIYGAPLMEIENENLCSEIVEHVEEILLNINMSYWQIKTRGDGKVSVHLPLVEDLEYMPEESNTQMDVYRVFIKYNDAFYRAYMLVMNKKRFAGVVFASPHIYSQNSLVLIEAVKGENPLKYRQDYLKYLVNNRRNEVIDVIEKYA